MPPLPNQRAVALSHDACATNLAILWPHCACRCIFGREPVAGEAEVYLASLDPSTIVGCMGDHAKNEQARPRVIAERTGREEREVGSGGCGMHKTDGAVKYFVAASTLDDTPGAPLHALLQPIAERFRVPLSSLLPALVQKAQESGDEGERGADKVIGLVYEVFGLSNDNRRAVYKIPFEEYMAEKCSKDPSFPSIRMNLQVLHCNTLNVLLLACLFALLSVLFVSCLAFECLMSAFFCWYLKQTFRFKQSRNQPAPLVRNALATCRPAPLARWTAAMPPHARWLKR